MKKAGIALVILTGMLLFGCSGKSSNTSTFTPTRSSIYVTRDGSVTSALVEPYENDYYDQTELKASIEEAVAEYNGRLGRNAVTLTSCTLGSGKAIAVFDYESSTDLCAFTGEMEDTANHAQNLVISTVKDGLSESEANLLWKKGNGSDVSANSVKKKGDWYLAAVDGAVTVQTEGKIRFYSGDVSLNDEFTADVRGGRAYIVFK